MWHCYLLNDDEPLIASLYSVQIVFWMLPWLLFDLNEPKSLIFYTAYYLIISLTIPELNTLFSLPFDTEGLKRGWLSTLVFFLAGISISCPLFFFMYMNYSGKVKLDSLIDRLKEQNLKLEESETKTREYIQHIEATRKSEQERNWVNDGEIMFNRKLQEVTMAGTFDFDRVIADFARYTGANQCALFVVKSTGMDGKAIILNSCYAFDRKKYLEKTIQIGEGIIGQAYLEKEMVILTDIPADFIKITSGLGEARPRQLVVSPLVYMNEVVGVLEVASFSKFDNHVVSLISKFSSGLAISLHGMNATRG